MLMQLKPERQKMPSSEHSLLLIHRPQPAVMLVATGPRLSSRSDKAALALPDCSSEGPVRRKNV